MLSEQEEIDEKYRRISSHEVEELIEAILAPRLRTVVSQVFSLNQDAIYPVSNTLPIFLRWVDSDTVNLEFAETILSPVIKHEFYPNTHVPTTTGELIKFYKPFGFYNKNLELTVLNEYVSKLNALISKGLVNPNLVFGTLTLQDNALIGALSMLTVLEAKNFRDKSLFSNGLKFDLLMTHDNEYVQAHLDDRYGIPGVLCAYQKVYGDDDDVALSPTVEYKSRFDFLYKKRLFTVYNRI